MGNAMDGTGKNYIYTVDEICEMTAKSGNGMEGPVKASHVVGIGASAGGLEAIESFFSKMPEDTGLAFVVVQHLSPDFKSLMDELLSRHTDMLIKRVEDGMTVEPNIVYLIPPKKEMIISGGKLLLSDKDPAQALSLPIDVFFRSLAQDAGERAVGIVLSGTGSDGSRGILDIHQAGGLVMVQDEKTAKFDGMPGSAIRTGISDFIIPPEQMPPALLNFLNHPKAPTFDLEKLIPDETPHSSFTRIFNILHKKFGIDFNHYKTNTISRRIQRRIAFHHLRDIEEYIELFEKDDAEPMALYKDLLIGVTKFFRDPNAFDFLEKKIIPRIVDNATLHEEIRVWIPGCATGEEVYSIAMLFDEYFSKVDKPLNIRIFATDINRDLLDFAAAGEYTSHEMQNVPQDRIERYFVHENGKYTINPDLRKTVVFAEHNLIKDPPFTRIDLISCRNLLIYFIPGSQKKVISLFHFALKLSGILFLGPSETIGDLSEEFDVMDHRWKVYSKKRDVRLAVSLRLPCEKQGGPSLKAQQAPAHQTISENRLLRVYDLLLDRNIHAGALVDDHFNVIHVFGNVYKYLRHLPGRVKLDILSMVTGDLRIALSAALNKSARKNEKVVYNNIRFKGDSAEEYITLTVDPIVDDAASLKYYYIAIDYLKPIPEHKTPTEEFDQSEESTNRIKELEQELQYTRENLQATVEELETSNEELQASNEELQSTNEELHSVNEELYTVNGEYERKIRELTELTNDMDNLFRSTEIGTVFLDNEMRIRKFTPSIAKSFNLIDQDVGRPLEHISYNMVGNPSMIDDAKKVLKTGKMLEREVMNRDGGWFIKRIHPYYNQMNEIEGVVLTFFDISSLKKTEGALQRSENRYRSLVEKNPSVIYQTADDDIRKKTYISPQITRILGYEAEDLLAGSPKWDNIVHPEDRERYEKEFHRQLEEAGHASIDYRLRHADGRLVWAREVCDIVKTPDDEPEYTLGVISDITERKQAETEKADEDMRKIDKAIDKMSSSFGELLELSRLGRVVNVPEKIDMNELAAEAVEILHGYLQSRDCKIKVEIADNMPPVFGDRNRIRQVLENLIGNSIKFMGKNPEPIIKIGYRKEDSENIFFVRDNGIGIEPEFHQQIFGLFNKLERTTDGTGAGLAIAKRIIEAHEGKIWVESEGKNKGTAFCFVIPETPKKNIIETKRPKNISRRKKIWAK